MFSLILTIRTIAGVVFLILVVAALIAILNKPTKK